MPSRRREPGATNPCVPGRLAVGRSEGAALLPRKPEPEAGCLRMVSTRFPMKGQKQETFNFYGCNSTGYGKSNKYAESNFLPYRPKARFSVTSG
ncbi:unnamed protein product [Rangifer tarandus platyrhynchus]|uniref:Uncharacterized protein n=2 Tax=Rangifer tarandus platyrhynchus TaxID=3082113 RepID=A0ACB0EN08_RANTA|nr:unnamed protein product [Rangifer tarandus platyrhynchus]CAI9701996.1 unnamed protein product [Rangifer tarandus platyrhynchus]